MSHSKKSTKQTARKASFASPFKPRPADARADYIRIPLDKRADYANHVGPSDPIVEAFLENPTAEWFFVLETGSESRCIIVEGVAEEDYLPVFQAAHRALGLTCGKTRVVIAPADEARATPFGQFLVMLEEVSRRLSTERWA